MDIEELLSKLTLNEKSLLIAGTNFMYTYAIKDLKIPSSLIPYCPKCGAFMTMNLRCDQTFVQDEGWDQGQFRYNGFINKHRDLKIIYLELGVGQNTPVIIKYPFWNYTNSNKKATYVCINYGESFCPDEIKKQAILINGDINQVINDLLLELEG